MIKEFKADYKIEKKINAITDKITLINHDINNLNKINNSTPKMTIRYNDLQFQLKHLNTRINILLTLLKL